MTRTGSPAVQGSEGWKRLSEGGRISLLETEVLRLHIDTRTAGELVKYLNLLTGIHFLVCFILFV